MQYKEVRRHGFSFLAAGIIWAAVFLLSLIPHEKVVFDRYVPIIAIAVIGLVYSFMTDMRPSKKIRMIILIHLVPIGLVVGGINQLISIVLGF